MGPLGKRVLGWLFGAEAAAAKAVLRQLELSNLLSYHAVDDIMSTGMVCSCSVHRLSHECCQRRTINHAAYTWRHVGGFP